jgi:poly(3-hydroxybutyrate) depolymerase
MKAHYQQAKVGHFGVFNGSCFRNEVVPRIRDFHASMRVPAKPKRLVENG